MKNHSDVPDDQQIVSDTEEVLEMPAGAIDEPDPLTDPGDTGELPDDDEELVEIGNEELLATYSEVADEDLSSSDLVDNGVAVEDLEQSPMGYRLTEHELDDPQFRETIDDRVRQEEPEEGSDVVPDQFREGR